MKRIALLVAALVLLVGCSTMTPPAAYVHADRATYDAVLPVVQITAQEHPELCGSIGNLMQSWNLRLIEAENANRIVPATQPDYPTVDPRRPQ